MEKSLKVDLANEVLYSCAKEVGRVIVTITIWKKKPLNILGRAL